MSDEKVTELTDGVNKLAIGFDLISKEINELRDENNYLKERNKQLLIDNTNLLDIIKKFTSIVDVTANKKTKIEIEKLKG